MVTCTHTPQQQQQQLQGLTQARKLGIYLDLSLFTIILGIVHFVDFIERDWYVAQPHIFVSSPLCSQLRLRFTNCIDVAFKNLCKHLYLSFALCSPRQMHFMQKGLIDRKLVYCTGTLKVQHHHKIAQLYSCIWNIGYGTAAGSFIDIR